LNIFAPVILLILILTGVVSPQNLTLADYGLGNTNYLLVYLLMYTLGMGVPMVLTSLIAKRRMNPFSASEHVSPSTVGLSLSAGMAMCVIANYVASILAYLLQSAGIQSPPMPTLQLNTPLSLGLNLLVFAVAPALLEEMVFRGYVLKTLRRYGDGLAVVITSLLFGLMHGNVLQIPFAFIVGLVLGYLVVQTNNIWLAVGLHFLNNAMSVLLEYAGFSFEETELNRLNVLVFASIAIVGLSAIIALTARRSKVTSAISDCRSPLTKSERASTIFTTPGFLIAVIIFVLLTAITTISVSSLW
jgi:membrane protease YdiL (CAAX protease family)